MLARSLMASTPSGILRDGRQFLEETQENVLLRRARQRAFSQFALTVLIERHHSPWANLISSCLQLRGELLFCRTVCTDDHAQHRVTVLSPSILHPFKSFEDQDTQGQPDQT